MQFVTQYQQPSTIGTQTGLLLVFMAATAQAPLPQAGIFSGQIAEPLVFRNLLLGLRHTVQARFYRPDLWRLLDPVITAGHELLRLECFSSCASVYARVDLTPHCFQEGEFYRGGTTNVDFNTAFLNHLSMLRPGKAAHFEMGETSIRLESHRGAAVEHRVELPERWVKGFLQVQAVQRQAQPLFELDRLLARQLLSAIPATSRATLYLVPRRHNPQVLHRKPATSEGFIALDGGHRLRLLQTLLPDLRALRVYQTRETGASIWVADTGKAQFTLGLSSRVSHGFSGDGDALRHLGAPTADPVDRVMARSAAQALNHFTIADLAEHQELSVPRATEIIDHLSMQGLLGYDRDRGRYFYRVLPFMADTPKAPARLKTSRALLENDPVRLEHCQRMERVLTAQGWVRGEHGYYRVTLTVDAEGYLREGTCTCPWVERHGLQRGPCKHLLALRFAAEAQA
jgi:hypothetical protein